jgi:hypothetical protein
MSAHVITLLPGAGRGAVLNQSQLHVADLRLAMDRMPIGAGVMVVVGFWAMQKIVTIEVNG